ncbi:Phosphoethanolamine N-methyltransferase-related protein [Histomonas meleagridis]|uniref:Phosphoethanolamine N-methyltransferase-related protein n=1 Tax=Histomonas meleagridis TaxID=135588 RepID=UPI003559FAFD|nr:Phosphoethanolamine N-methyltransferase-related protein [Histomonas meleagridis]KAH0799275.1 Phosphoethanolamine N-methyltransferase-related protein [Histomonas meleagridis]
MTDEQIEEELQKMEQDIVISPEDIIQIEEDSEEIDFSNPQYWDKRYAKTEDGSFEWYRPWKEFYPEFKEYFNGDEKVLNIGCGNSEMAYDMLGNPFHSVYNMDISSVVIDQMKSKYQDQKELIWEVMDCTNMTYEDNSFDVVFDKGTLDALFCGDMKNVEKTICEVARILKPNGIYIVITYGPPNARVPVFQRFKDKIELVQQIDFKKRFNCSTHFIYILKKKNDSD